MMKEAQRGDLPALARLAVQLWTGHTVEDMEREFAQIMDRGESRFFIKYDGEEPAGFAQCQLRHDYVEGTSTSPVGYLEGIFVGEAHRNRGYAAELLAACEAWARACGCTEFASDCELGNTASQRFHRAMGFDEANRIVCFTKPL